MCSFSCLEIIKSRIQTSGHIICDLKPSFAFHICSENNSLVNCVEGSQGNGCNFNLSLISKSAKVVNMGIYMKIQSFSCKLYFEHVKLYELIDCVCRVFFLVLSLHQHSCYLRGPRFGKLLGLFRVQRLRQMLLQSHSDFSFDQPVFYPGSVCLLN